MCLSEPTRHGLSCRHDATLRGPSGRRIGNCLALNIDRSNKMALCKACEELIGQPTTLKPHAMLVREFVGFRAHGDIERLRCRTCDNKLERLIANEAHTNAKRRAGRLYAHELSSARPHDLKPASRTPEARTVCVSEVSQEEWKFVRHYGRTWYWRHTLPSGTQRVSSRVFATLEECVKDAIGHGYVPRDTEPCGESA